MQQIETREFGTGHRHPIGAWDVDQADMVNALMGAAWRHHVNRRSRARNFFRRLIRG